MSRYIYPYKAGSRSAVVLKQGLNAKLLKLENSKFKGNKNKIVINWGSSAVNEEVEKSTVINSPEAVKKAANKLLFFQSLHTKVEIPEFTRSIEEARKWFEEDKNCLVFNRTVLTGHSGIGIVKIEKVDELSSKAKEGDLLVKYVPKRSEFRVHTAKKVGSFCIQEKLLRTDGQRPTDEAIDFKIRNHANGFIFARNLSEDSKNLKARLEKLASSVIDLLELDFGAVDVIYNKRQDKLYALEVNTAPGLENSTVQDYLTMFERLLS